jgi:hypothetical protein
MDREYIEQHNIVDRYVMGQLTEAETTEFELYFLENPALLDDIAMARSLRGNLELQRSETPRAQGGPLAGMWKTFLAWYRIPWVVAANVSLIAALSGLLYHQLSAVQTTGFAGQRLWIGQMRGAGPAPLRVEPRAPMLILEFDVDTAGSYALSLVGTDGVSRLRVADLAAEDGTVLAVLPLSQLPADCYQLRITGARGGAVLERQLAIGEFSCPARP